MKTEYISKPQTQSASSPLPPIFPIHGLWGSNDQWSYYSDKFPGHQFLSYDLPGHGSRPGNLDRKSIGDYVDDAIAHIRKVGRRAIILGHSAGGLAGQMIAEKEPDLVERLVLLASSAPRSSGARLPFKTEFLRLWLGKALVTGNEFALPKYAEELVAGGAHVKLGPESGRALRELFLYTFDVKKISCPVNVIAAKDDFFMPVSFQQKIADHFGVELITLPGDHMFHCDYRCQSQVIETIRSVLCGDFEDKVIPFPDTRTAPAVHKPAWATT